MGRDWCYYRVFFWFWDIQLCICICILRFGAKKGLEKLPALAMHKSDYRALALAVSSRCLQRKKQDVRCVKRERGMR